MSVVPSIHVHGPVVPGSCKCKGGPQLQRPNVFMHGIHSAVHGKWGFRINSSGLRGLALAQFEPQHTHITRPMSTAQ